MKVLLLGVITVSMLCSSPGMVPPLPGPLQTVAQFLLGKRLRWEFGKRRNTFQIEQSTPRGDGAAGVPDDFFLFLNWANNTFRNVTLLPLNEIFRKTMDMFRLTMFRSNAIVGPLQGMLPIKSWRIMPTRDLDLAHFSCKLSTLAYDDEWKIRRFLHSRGLRLLRWANEAQPNLPAFFIAEDPRDNTLVISVRGTNHVNDVFTSFQTNVTNLRVYRNESDVVVHAGFLRSARCILEQEVLPLVRKKRGRKVLITGHSLGGAVATLLTLLLERGSENPYPLKEVKGITFGAPPSVSSMVKLPQLTSISMEGDLVPRLSMQNAQLIRDFFLNNTCPPDHFDQPPIPDSLLVPGKIFWIYNANANLPGGNKVETYLRMVDQEEHNKLVFGWHILEQHTLGVYHRNIKELRDKSYQDRFPRKAEDTAVPPPGGNSSRGPGKPARMEKAEEGGKRVIKSKKKKKHKGIRFAMNILGSEYHI
mmetsp:Transcript_11335/g.17911  ORF Transcript_11335/g.17911 Transcript_11335/m.17911 type:complete len:476 (-) Transcript_11335:25-1452(-)